MKKILLLVFLFIFCLQTIVPASNVKTTTIEESRVLILRGINLSDSEAQKLESELKSAQNNLTIRTQLLGYYSIRSFKSTSAQNARLQHIIWIIQNRPDSVIAGWPYAQLHPNPTPNDYGQVKNLWLKQVDAHKKNTTVLGNAARFFILQDRDEAERLFKKAQSLEPNNPTWAEELAALYRLSVIGVMEPETRSKIQKNAFVQQEKSANKITDQQKKFRMLAQMSNTAFESGEIKKAEEYTKELLDMSPKFEKDSYYGRAIHLGNIILGRVALKRGSMKEAKTFLLRAGEVTGSPEMNMFGPNMALAKELLEKGEREVVLEYLRLCKKFWNKNTLNRLIQSVEAGSIPVEMELMRSFY